MNNNTQNEITKVCSRCKRSLPSNLAYFFKLKNAKDGLESACKECRGFSFKPPKRKAREGYKICGRCKTEKKATNYFFYTTIRTKDGFYGRCIDCEKEENKNNYHKNKEKRNTYNKKYYYENRTSILGQSKQYRNKNLDRLIEKDRKYYEENKDEVKRKARDYHHKHKHDRHEYIKGWRKNNKDKLRIYSLKRHTTKKNLPDDFNVSQWNECKQHFGYKCCYCGKEERLTQDHFIPLYNGGEYTKDNILPCCKSCNSSKNKRDFFDWYPQQEFYSKQREQKILKYLNYESNKTQQLSIF